VSQGRFVLVCAVLAAVAIGSAFALGGGVAALGMALGIVFTTFSLFTTWFLIKAVAPAAGKKTTPAVLVFLLFALKLPLLGISVVVAVKLGIASLVAFLTGIILVYFAMIWRVQTLPPQPDRSE
jgi:hypothetical protein